MTTLAVRTVLTVLLCITLASARDANAQRIPNPRISQPATVSQMVGDTRINITYNRPSARGRDLFGGIVRFGRVWCPGADEATAIEVSKDILLGGTTLTAGKYSVWMIPRAEPEDWTLILSKAADVFHNAYPEGQDALRLQIKPKRGAHMESLTFYFPAADSVSATLAMQWGETVIEAPIAKIRGTARDTVPSRFTHPRRR